MPAIGTKAGQSAAGQAASKKRTTAAKQKAAAPFIPKKVRVAGPVANEISRASKKVRSAKTSRQRRKAKILRKLLKDPTETLDVLSKREKKIWEGANELDRVEARSDARAKKWWKAAKSVSGLTGPAPKTKWGDIGQSMKKDPTAAHVISPKGKPIVEFAATGVTPASTAKGRKSLRSLAFHEFAHVGQRRANRHPYDPPKDEGRADRFSKMVTKRLGRKFIPRSVYSSGYAPYRKLSHERDKPGTVLRKQFKPARHPSTKRSQKGGASPGPDRKKVKKAKPLKVKLDSAGLLGPRQTQFTTELAKRTGLSARVLGGMAASEQPKDSPSVEGSDNWLNIGYSDSGPGGPTQDRRFFKGPKEAAKVTAKFLKGKELGASEGIQNILSTAGKSDQKQVRAIQGSGWASSGHPNLPGLASQMSGTPGKKIVRAKEKGRPIKATTGGLLSGATKLKSPQRQMLKAMVKEATKIDKANKPYVYGGGHVAGKIPGIKKTNYDCSSVTSRILQKTGALPKDSGTLVSGDFMSYGDPGPGTVTIFANDGHVFMRIGDRYFGTSSADNTGSGGFLTEATGASEAASGNYTVRHVPELGKAKVGLKGLPGIALSNGGTTASITSGTTLATPGSSAKPIKREGQRKAKKMEGKERSKLIRAAIAGEAEAPAPEAFTPSTETYAKAIRRAPVKLGL